ncbi:hypothetical protein OG379_32700 [Streptomyces sp. NBC_01166]|nr:hypothetical protein OG379_32700 [Streptomyces sp. NBC_01166]
MAESKTLRVARDRIVIRPDPDEGPRGCPQSPAVRPEGVAHGVR